MVYRVHLYGSFRALMNAAADGMAHASSPPASLVKEHVNRVLMAVGITTIAGDQRVTSVSYDTEDGSNIYTVQAKGKDGKQATYKLLDTVVNSANPVLEATRIQNGVSYAAQ